MKKITRKEKSENTEKSIIDATLALLSEYPFQNLQIKQICQKANTSIGGFYHHFPNKYSIIQKIVANNTEYFFDYNNKISKESSFDNIMVILNEFCTVIENIGYELALEIFIHNVISSKDGIMMDTDGLLYKSIYEEVGRLQADNKIHSTESISEITKNIIIVFRGFVFEWGLSKGSYNLTQNITQQLTKYLTLF